MPTVEQLAEQQALLETQQSLLTEAVRRILEGRWSGVDGAAAMIVALEGGDSRIVPVEFPPKDE